MNYKLFPAIAFTFCLAASCNMAGPTKTNSTDKTATDSALKAKDSTFSAAYSTEKIKSLQSHFPANKNFPVSIDSAYMTMVAKGHDSLGANEVKMLVKPGSEGMLAGPDSSELSNFCKLDSIKKNHALEKWMDNHPDGMPTQMNAYALQETPMADETLLIWAFVFSAQQADPIYEYTDIYCSVLKSNAILITYKLGELSDGMDPPMGWESSITGKLGEDGKLLIDKKNTDFDIDSDTAVLNHIHYEYLFHQGFIKLQSKKEDAPKEFKMTPEKQ